MHLLCVPLLHPHCLLLMPLFHLLSLLLAVVPLLGLLVLPCLLLRQLLVLCVLSVDQILLFLLVSLIKLAIAGVCRSHLVLLKLGGVRWRRMIRRSRFPCGDDTLAAEVSWPGGRSNRWLALVL